MKWMITNNLMTLAQNYISVNFITNYLGWKNKCKWNPIVFILVLIMLQGESHFIGRYPTYIGFSWLLRTIIFMLFSTLLLGGSYYQRVLIIFIDLALKNSVWITILFVASYSLPLEMLCLNGFHKFQQFIIILISLLSYLFLTRLILRVFKNKRFALSKSEWFAILSVFIASFAVSVFVLQILATSPQNSKNDVYTILIIIFLIIINVICFFLFANISDKNNEKLYYSYVELQLLEQEKSILGMKKSYEEIRKIKHDMKGYLECVLTLLHNGKGLEAKNYLSTLLESKIDIDMQMITTKSDIVNAVISSKMSLCKKNNIKFSYEIIGSVEEVSDLDLSILLSNLLNNAIEAAVKVEKNPEISLKIYDDRNYLVILIDNTIKESVLNQNPNLNTTKKDKLHHGVGSLSIKDIVKKHNGMMSMYEKDRKFIVDIWLNRNINN